MLEDKVKLDGNSPQQREHWGPFVGGAVSIMAYSVFLTECRPYNNNLLNEWYGGFVVTLAPVAFVIAGVAAGMALEHWYRGR